MILRLTTLALLLALALLLRQSPAPTIVAVAAPTPCAADDLALDCPPQLTAAELDAILASYGSPATGTGAAWVAQGREWGLNPELALAFFVHESSAGTAPGWAGWKVGGGSTHNVGNIVCTPGWTCYGRFRDYPSWEAGIADWYRLIAVEYRDGRGHRSVEDVIPVYAPSIENDVAGYVGAVRGLVREWREVHDPRRQHSHHPTGHLHWPRQCALRAAGVGAGELARKLCITFLTITATRLPSRITWHGPCGFRLPSARLRVLSCPTA